MKDKFKIAFFGKDSHAGCMIDMFQDALPGHPNVESVDFETTFARFGKANVVPMRGEKYLLENIKKYDLIFLQAEQIALNPEICIEKIFDDLGLWGHTVLCDFKDNQIFEKQYLSKCLLYFKRSWQDGFIPREFNNILPIPPCVFDFYPNIVPSGTYGIRDLSVTCTLMQGNRGRGWPRDIVAKAVKDADWTLPNGELAPLTLFYGVGQNVSNAATFYRTELSWPTPYLNWWNVYMHILKRTKILFNAIHSEVGDIGENRTWEALGSGVVLFTNKIEAEGQQPYIDGVHYVKIDLDDIPKAINRAKELLMNETELKKIAETGFDFSMKYHSSQARINYVMEEIIKRLKKEQICVVGSEKI